MLSDRRSLSSLQMKLGKGSPRNEERKTIRLFDNLLEKDLVTNLQSEEWIKKIFAKSAVYEGTDELLWGKYLACVYKDPETSKISSLIFDKLGVTQFIGMDISSKSQYYPAIENLSPKDQESNVKKCIAVSLLQKFAELSADRILKLQPNGLKFDYDPTHAGDLASSCKLVDFCTPEDIGRSVLSLGFLQRRSIQSMLLDVVYERKESLTEINNRLVFHLGEQLEQLFDPLTEYSPEQTEYTYKPPEQDTSMELDDKLEKSIINELLQLQTNFTLTLVDFLQRFLINLRVKVLNEEIEGLSTIKLNRLFPPTIDEVTRINCIFLDSLKSALPFGSLEIIKACSVTIPYFYKAYTRHEAATKNFAKDYKLFSKKFNDCIPRDGVYSDMKVESIINGPQEKLLKLKLIIDRLYETKSWGVDEKPEAKKQYDNIVQAIDSFGKMESPLSSYSTRVFTPSGKILTEIAKGWPQELQYKWLKRRVVGVFDFFDGSDKKNREILVIFSDYIVFLEVIDGSTYYAGSNNNKPRIADILMNSLINEVPLPSKIPKIQVRRYCYIDDVIVTILNENSLRFDAMKGENSFSISCMLCTKSTSAFTVADLVVKAKILEKETAFHLFKATVDGNTLYSTAHELEAYENESLKSKFCLFLNMEPTKEAFVDNDLHTAIFAKFTASVDAETVQLDILRRDGEKSVLSIQPQEIIEQIFNTLWKELPALYSSLSSPFSTNLLTINGKLLVEMGSNVGYAQEPVKMTNSASNSFVQDHEKKKSFGTITTFRSYASDYKDVVTAVVPTSDTPPTMIDDTKNPIKRQKEVSQVINNRKATSKPSSNVGEPKKRPVESSRKRKSIIDVFKGMFGGSAHKHKSKHIQLNSVNTKKISRPILKDRQREGLQKGDDFTKGNALDNAYKSERGQNRVSSVIRSSKFARTEGGKGSSNAVIQPFDNENQDDGSTSAPNECPKSHHELEKEMPKYVKDASIEVKDSSIEVKEAIPAEPLKVSDVRDQNDSIRSSEFEETPSKNSEYLCREETRQSRLFNDDLYGEMHVERIDEVSVLNKEKNELPCYNNNEKASSPAHHAKTELNSSTAEQNTNINHHESPYKISSLDNINESDKRLEPHIPSKKTPIFPKIPIREPPKIDFVRSTSFIELFKDMRLVLDKSDAQYNWRRISSETSLHEKSLVNYEEQSSHAFNIIAHNNTIKHGTTSDPKIPQSSQTNAQEILSLIDSHISEPDKSGSRMEELSSANDHPVTKELDSDGACEAAFIDEESKQGSTVALPNPPNFRVLKTSPVRIMKRTAKGPELEGKDITFNYDFSISSDLNTSAGKRWIELKLPSQEDLEEYENTAAENNKTSRDALEVDDRSSISPCVSEVNDSSMETSVEEASSLKQQEGLIDDFEFSSFHMSFDAPFKNETTSQSDSPFIKPKQNDIITTQRQDAKLFEQEPILYRLPKDLTFTSKSQFSNELFADKPLQQKNSSNEDDPIWVSPSKIDFNDLSCVISSAASRKNVLDRLPHAKSPSQEDPERSPPSKELSYAYLASLVCSDLSSENFEDKPVRLQFRE